MKNKYSNFGLVKLRKIAKVPNGGVVRQRRYRQILRATLRGLGEIAEVEKVVQVVSSKSLPDLTRFIFFRFSDRRPIFHITDF